MYIGFFYEKIQNNLQTFMVLMNFVKIIPSDAYKKLLEIYFFFNGLARDLFFALKHALYRKK